MPFVRLALVRYQPNALPGSEISKVVLAEFSQVLPRRRASLSRNGASVYVNLHGTVPHHGPMKFPVETEYTDVSFVHGPHETGRNRIELVLQTRDPALDSDLAWSDAKTLGSSVVGATDNDNSVVVPGINPGGIFAGPAVSSASFRTLELRAGSAVRLASSVDLSDSGVTAKPGITTPVFLEPEIWATAATLPSTGDKPARLMLREFERYYTDKTVPEVRSGSIHQRRLVEERLVYAAIFDLD